MTIHVGVSGVNKAVTDVKVGVSGAWKRVTDGWVGVGGVWKRFLQYGSIVSPFTVWDMIADQPGGVTATASLTFAGDGSVSGNATQDGGSSPGSTSWFSPNISGIGAGYYIRFTPTTGTFTTNGASTFSSLSSARTVTKAGSTSSASVTFTIEIATDSGGSNIVFTSANNLLRFQHTL